jgi:hypothetical protein
LGADRTKQKCGTPFLLDLNNGLGGANSLGIYDLKAGLQRSLRGIRLNPIFAAAFIWFTSNLPWL